MVETGRLQQAGVFHMRQRMTLMVNRYEIRADDGQGGEGELVAFAQQKRVAFKEQVTLYTDSDKTEVLAGFRARKALDLASGYDVTDAAGTPIGLFRKDFRKSLARSTWHLEQPGHPVCTGHERSKPIAVLRRLWEFIPLLENIPFFFPYHFDFAVDGRNVVSVERKVSLRDRYVIKVEDERLDRRLVFAQAIALDALQGR
ncbi:hypothetical protein OOZ19_23720 [Saccharopolyspora sp. NFXS83]|uniref:hypothetical protein n=1 Tax=Saccharopolyspora sp. NFXS83 TaxID=2993560 RepID=UPI00224B1101|nr:hypothetical protein [Saccharopolyspora sp. NFXS83]MCX2733262.1 hypothetical protein [Saccharopolyspora sp. NFXS83]